jgi:hypothetical protein
MAAVAYDIAALKALPASKPSICIPRVFPNITWQRVKSVFEELGFGDVEKVDMVNKTSSDGKPIKRVFVHFKAWNTLDDQVNQARTDLLNGQFVQLTYDQPWFWRCYMSNVPRPQQSAHNPTQPHKKLIKGTRKPRISIKKPHTEEMREVMSLKEEIADLKNLIKTMTGDIKRPTMKKIGARKPKMMSKPHFTTSTKLTIRAPPEPTSPAYAPTSPAYAPGTPAYAPGTPVYEGTTPVESLTPAYAPCSPVEYEPTTPIEGGELASAE